MGVEDRERGGGPEAMGVGRQLAVWSELGVVWRVRRGLENRKMSVLCNGGKCGIGGGQFGPGLGFAKELDS